MNEFVFLYSTQTAEGFDIIVDLGQDLATKAYRASILAGTPRIYRDQEQMDTAALAAARLYREERQAQVPNLTDDDERFDAAWASGYIVATCAEQDAYQSDPKSYQAKLFQSMASHLPAAHIVDAVPQQQGVVPKLETIRTLAFVAHEQLVEAYERYVQEVGQSPRIEVRGLVDFVEPGNRPGRWRKKREVELSDWYEVRDWRRDEALLLIEYRLTGGIYRNYPQTLDQWVRPSRIFHEWYHLRLSRSLANENAAYLAYLQHEREEGRIW